MDRLAKTTVRLANLKAAAPEGTELGEIGGTALELMRRPYISYELIAKVIGRGRGCDPCHGPAHRNRNPLCRLYRP